MLAQVLDQLTPGKEKILKLFRHLEQRSLHIETVKKAMIELYIVCNPDCISNPAFEPRKAQKDSFSSAFYFFCLFLVYCLCYCPRIEVLKRFGLFTSIYIMVDGYMDDPDIPKSVKLEQSIKLGQLLRNPELKDQIDICPIFYQAITYYQECLRYAPRLKIYLPQMLEAQLKGIETENQPDLAEHNYITNCLNKGSISCHLIMAFLEPYFSPEQATIHSRQLLNYGGLFQLSDDCCDLNEDLENGINTWVIYNYRKYGNLDRILALFVEKIWKTEGINPLLIFINFFNLFYGIYRKIDYFSIEVRQFFQELYHYYDKYIGQLDINITSSLIERCRQLRGEK